MARASVDWGAEYDALAAQPRSFVRALADARRPNSSPDHDSAAHLERVHATSSLIVRTMVRAAALLAADPRQRD